LVEALDREQRRFQVMGTLVDSDFAEPGDSVGGSQVLGDLGWLERHGGEVALVIAVGRSELRAKLCERALSLGGHFTSLAHPSATLGSRVEIGSGVVIAAGCVLTCDIVLADHVQVNLGSTLSHDCRLEAFATVSPGVHLAGGVEVGEGAFVGVGTSVLQNVKIGAWSVVGAGATVTRDVPPNSTVVGCPAQVVSRRPPGWQRAGEAAW
jgi:sugar O-acyltransferase (sialic acid O-acetyltransferase NeuD family)